jgi:hypothetical protein
LSFDPFALAVRAWIWGYPLVEATRLRQRFTSPGDPFAPRPASSAGAPLNRVGHQRRLSDPTLGGVAPNVDTLYSLAWLDLAGGPFVLEAPDFGERYYTFQLAYGDTGADHSLGRRTHGSRLPPVVVHGPGAAPRVPAGAISVASPTRYFMIGGRVLVRPDDPADFEAVRKLQSQITVRRLTGDEGAVPAERPLDEGVDDVDPDLHDLQRLGNVLRDWIVSPGERRLVESFRRIGLTCEAGFEPGALSPHAVTEVVRGVAEATGRIERRTHDLGTSANGWTTNYLGPRFGDDYLLRAAVAKDQIYVTVPEEALYPAASHDSEGRPLDGAHAYRIAFPAGGLPPVEAFWSVTLYAAAGGLVANPIDRYAIGDRTPGLVWEADGSLSIRIQHEPPGDGNWLPAPAGPFRLILRLYVPREEARSGAWAPPAVERVPAA